jgi:hypothetical protein
MVSHQVLYDKYDDTLHRNATLCGVSAKKASSEMSAIKQFMIPKQLASGDEQGVRSNGFARMDKCRMGLDALDRAGWKRSYHQRKFHDAFIAACARAFFKLDEAGSFQRAYQHVLEINGWSNLNQEILISTPRRFGNHLFSSSVDSFRHHLTYLFAGKTISVSMFAAALLYSAGGCELSIYATCKSRYISQISPKSLPNSTVCFPSSHFRPIRR